MEVFLIDEAVSIGWITVFYACRYADLQGKTRTKAVIISIMVHIRVVLPIH